VRPGKSNALESWKRRDAPLSIGGGRGKKGGRKERTGNSEYYEWGKAGSDSREGGGDKQEHLLWVRKKKKRGLFFGAGGRDGLYLRKNLPIEKKKVYAAGDHAPQKEPKHSLLFYQLFYPERKIWLKPSTGKRGGKKKKTKNKHGPRDGRRGKRREGKRLLTLLMGEG